MFLRTIYLNIACQFSMPDCLYKCNGRLPLDLATYRNLVLGMPLRKANGAGMLIYDTLSHSLMPNNMFVNLLWLKFPCFIDLVVSSCCLDDWSYQGIENGYWPLSLGARRNICIDNQIYNVYLYSDLWNFGPYMYMYCWGRTVGKLIICDRENL